MEANAKKKKKTKVNKRQKQKFYYVLNKLIIDSFS